MDPILGVIFVCWCIKVLAEDSYSTVTGKPNQRLERRKARQKSRANNPIWTQITGWLGDVAEDARNEQNRRRKEKRDRQERDRKNAEAVEAEVVEDAEIIDEPGDGKDAYAFNQPPTCPADGSRCQQACLDGQRRACDPRGGRHEDLTEDECTYDFCPYHGKPKRAEEKNTNPEPRSGNQKGRFAMTEFQGLDGCIAYCEELLAAMSEHTQAGASGEQYIPYLEASKVSGATLQSAHDMLSAVGAACGAIEEHKSRLEDQKVVQEAYDAQQDAGDKDFQQAGR